jgi:hypothetical protein
MTHQFRALKVAHTDFKLRKIWCELEIDVGCIKSLWLTLIRELSVVAKLLPLITPIC